MDPLSLHQILPHPLPDEVPPQVVEPRQRDPLWLVQNEVTIKNLEVHVNFFVKLHWNVKNKCPSKRAIRQEESTSIR